MKILDQEVQKFINANLTADLHYLLLKKSPFSEVSMQQIVQQIKGKKVAAKKFPFLMQNDIVFPPNLNLEQASSQSTSIYKSTIIEGEKMLDLTCGFGIDAYFLSQKFHETTLVERNAELLEIVKHNWQVLGKTANYINKNLEEFLKNNTEKFDLVYLDPARRDERKNKVFLLEDLSPNLIEIEAQLFDISNFVMTKLSPLIDISYLVSILKNICRIDIVAVKNEVKEILVLQKTKENATKIICTCINLETEEAVFSYYFNEEKSAVSEYSSVGQYLYIPNNALLKAGVFNLISERFKLKKLHPNTHFYTSDQYLEHFPGRILEVEKISANDIKKGEKFNIISKNHPLSPEEIKKKYKISDGGFHYLIFTQTEKEKVILRSK